MSVLVARLRHTKAGYVTAKLDDLVQEAADRIEALEAALKPFAQTGWMTGEIEHTARTIVAHMHPEREREIILSSDDFKRASDLLALEKPRKPVMAASEKAAEVVSGWSDAKKDYASRAVPSEDNNTVGKLKT